MQFNNEVTRSVAEAARKVMAGENTENPEQLNEELKGDQHKLDKNKNNKLDSEDFEILRGEKKVQEETELTESHFKVGDKVKCKTSGMKGEVVKLDKEHGEDDDKYYTVKREDGKEMKMAPEDLTKLNEEAEQLDELSKKTLGSYAKKAAYDTVTKGIDYGSKMDQSGSQHKELGKINKREKGVQKAIDRLAKEEVEIEEGTKVQVAPGRTRNIGTHGRAQGSEYGGTDWDKEETRRDTKPKKKGYGARQNFVRSTRVNEGFTGLLETYNEGGIKSLLNVIGSKIEEEVDNETFTAELEDQKASMKGLKKQPKVAKSSVQAVKVEEEVELEERELTDSEKESKEDYVKGMKKGLQDFKQRYGDRAKEVMHATATKMAKED